MNFAILVVCYAINMSAKIFHSRKTLIPGSSYTEVVARARKEFNTIRRITKRQPYVRSKYFRGDKIFMTVFWDHSMQKHPKERRKRLRLYSAAVDLFRNNTIHPDQVVENKLKGYILLRFYGITRDGVEFCVQIKQELRSNRKDFMSVFERKLK